MSQQDPKVEKMLDNLSEGVMFLDENGKIVSVNNALAEIFCVEKEKAPGSSLIEYIRNHELENFIKNALESQRGAEQEFELVTPVELVVRIKASLYGSQPEKRGLLVIINDMTATRKLEKIRVEFAANVSHELKTPLAAIKGYIETLQDGAIDDKKNNIKFLKIIGEQVERLDRLISDLLELSKIESGKKEITLARFSINELFDSVKIIAGHAAEKKKVVIKAQIPPNFADVLADKNMMEIALLNLVDNAVKFSSNSEVVISVERSDGKVKLTVSDSGIGIPVELLPRIFERFFRADKARSREFGGTGLGLSIVKHVMEVHHGSVLVESEPEKGSKFTLAFPD